MLTLQFRDTMNDHLVFLTYAAPEVAGGNIFSALNKVSVEVNGGTASS